MHTVTDIHHTNDCETTTHSTRHTHDTHTRLKNTHTLSAKPRLATMSSHHPPHSTDPPDGLSPVEEPNTSTMSPVVPRPRPPALDLPSQRHTLPHTPQNGAPHIAPHSTSTASVHLHHQTSTVTLAVPPLGSRLPQIQQQQQQQQPQPQLRVPALLSPQSSYFASSRRASSASFFLFPTAKRSAPLVGRNALSPTLSPAPSATATGTGITHDTVSRNYTNPDAPRSARVGSSLPSLPAAAHYIDARNNNYPIANSANNLTTMIPILQPSLPPTSSPAMSITDSDAQNMSQPQCRMVITDPSSPTNNVVTRLHERQLVDAAPRSATGGASSMMRQLALSPSTLGSIVLPIPFEDDDTTTYSGLLSFPLEVLAFIIDMLPLQDRFQVAMCSRKLYAASLSVQTCVTRATSSLANEMIAASDRALSSKVVPVDNITTSTGSNHDSTDTLGISTMPTNNIPSPLDTTSNSTSFLKMHSLRYLVIELAHTSPQASSATSSTSALITDTNDVSSPMASSTHSSVCSTSISKNTEWMYSVCESLIVLAKHAPASVPFRVRLQYLECGSSIVLENLRDLFPDIREVRIVEHYTTPITHMIRWDGYLHWVLDPAFAPPLLTSITLACPLLFALHKFSDYGVSLMSPSPRTVNPNETPSMITDAIPQTIPLTIDNYALKSLTLCEVRQGVIDDLLVFMRRGLRLHNLESLTLVGVGQPRFLSAADNENTVNGDNMTDDIGRQSQSLSTLRHCAPNLKSVTFHGFVLPDDAFNRELAGLDYHENDRRNPWWTRNLDRIDLRSCELALPLHARTLLQRSLVSTYSTKANVLGMCHADRQTVQEAADTFASTTINSHDFSIAYTVRSLALDGCREIVIQDCVFRSVTVQQPSQQPQSQQQQRQQQNVDSASTTPITTAQNMAENVQSPIATLETNGIPTNNNVRRLSVRTRAQLVQQSVEPLSQQQVQQQQSRPQLLNQVGTQQWRQIARRTRSRSNSDGSIDNRRVSNDGNQDDSGSTTANNRLEDYDDDGTNPPATRRRRRHSRGTSVSPLENEGDTSMPSIATQLPKVIPFNRQSMSFDGSSSARLSMPTDTPFSVTAATESFYDNDDNDDEEDIEVGVEDISPTRNNVQPESASDAALSEQDTMVVDNSSQDLSPSPSPLPSPVSAGTRVASVVKEMEKLDLDWDLILPVPHNLSDQAMQQYRYTKTDMVIDESTIDSPTLSPATEISFNLSKMQLTYQALKLETVVCLRNRAIGETTTANNGTDGRRLSDVAVSNNEVSATSTTSLTPDIANIVSDIGSVSAPVSLSQDMGSNENGGMNTSESPIGTIPSEPSSVRTINNNGTSCIQGQGSNNNSSSNYHTCCSSAGCCEESCSAKTAAGILASVTGESSGRVMTLLTNEGKPIRKSTMKNSLKTELLPALFAGAMLNVAPRLRVATVIDKASSLIN